MADRTAGSLADGGLADRVETWHVGVVLVVAGLAFAFTPLYVQLPGETLLFFDVAVLFLVYAMLVVGLNLHFGHTGLVNFGHVAFFAVGGYAAAMLTASDPFAGVGLGLPWPVGVGGAILAAAALGGLLGVTTLRLRDDFLAIVTLAVAEILHDLLGSFRSITGGGVGLADVAQPIRSAASSAEVALFATTLVFAGVLALVYATAHRLTTAPYGRVLHAIRADDRVTATLGKHVFRYKLAAFVYGAAIAGLAGALYAFYLGSVSPGVFGLNVTVLVWIGMLIGGPANDRAVVAGVAIILGFRLLTRFLNEATPMATSDQFASLRLIAVGVLLVVVIRYRPEGIWGDPDRLGVKR